MNCHKSVWTKSPKLLPVRESYANGTPISWVKVHDLPDFVHFTHEKHLRRFVFKNEGMPVERVYEVCAFCHGDIKEETVARKTRPLTMGFCRQCHEDNKGPFDCWKCHK